MRPDLIALHHNYRAKASGMSRADYASAVTRFESKPYPRALWISLVLGLAVALAASLDWI